MARGRLPEPGLDRRAGVRLVDDLAGSLAQFRRIAADPELGRALTREIASRRGSGPCYNRGACRSNAPGMAPSSGSRSPP